MEIMTFDASHLTGSRMNTQSDLLDRYQIFVELMSKGRGLPWAALELTGEAGEVAGEIAKMIRKDDGVLTDDRKAAIATELGDTIWGCAAVANELGIYLTDVIEHNIKKLEERYGKVQ